MMCGDRRRPGGGYGSHLHRTRGLMTLVIDKGLTTGGWHHRQNCITQDLANRSAGPSFWEGCATRRAVLAPNLFRPYYRPGYSGEVKSAFGITGVCWQNADIATVSMGRGTRVHGEG